MIRHHNKDVLHHNRRGFTIIELMLAIVGIAFLLLFILFGIVYVANLYAKGVAMRQINQAGRQITDEFSRALRYGSTPIVLADKHRLCVGGKAYIWNEDSSAWKNTTVKGEDIQLVVVDNTAPCDNPVTTSPSNDIPSNALSLLGDAMAVLKLTVVKSSSDPIYNISIVLSTGGDNKPIFIGPGYGCSPVNGQHCAFGEFETNVYARGG